MLLASPSVFNSRMNVARIPRPPNRWILYRKDKLRELDPETRRDIAAASKKIGNMWSNESPAVRLKYERRAAELKVKHQLKYPGYKFKPVGSSYCS